MTDWMSSKPTATARTSAGATSKWPLQIAAGAAGSFDRLGFRTLFVHELHEWNVVGRDDCISAASRSVRPLNTPPRS
jgi:hypothetical protein